MERDSQLTNANGACSNRPVAGFTSHSDVATTEFPSDKLEEALKAKAREIGFDNCRVAVCGPPLHGREFNEWLRDGAAGEMHYMERGAEKRSDPQKILPGARSVIVVALNYWQGDEEDRGVEGHRSTPKAFASRQPNVQLRISRHN